MPLARMSEEQGERWLNLRRVDGSPSEVPCGVHASWDEAGVIDAVVDRAPAWVPRAMNSHPWIARMWSRKSVCGGEGQAPWR